MHKPKKHMCCLVFGLHKLKKPKTLEENQRKPKKNSRKPKNQSSLPKPAKVFGSLVFWFFGFLAFSRLFWFSLVFLELFLVF